jgi:acyl transferase domain-containing protein/aryl carrier-like protein
MAQDTASPDISAIKLALMARQARAETAPALRADPIAIIGMGCRLPGGVDTPDRFWQLLCAGTETAAVVPPDRWDADGWYDPDLATAGKTVTRRGSFLDRIDGFDASYFGIAPREADRMDPQQRLFLEVAIEALDDAGLSRPRLAGSRTGVFAASYHNDYARLQYADVDAIDLRTLTGTLHSVLANRLSHFLDLRGPSLTIDSACSASLTAVHLACQSLRLGETDMAIAGGVSLIIGPELVVAMSKVGFMAPDGRSKAFDARADGFGRGEGCSLLVLKRLSDAIADRDRVLAVIRGSAVNQDGHSTILTAPNGRAQEMLIREALSAARLSPERIGFVETHGTGTALGDPIEVEAIAATLGRAGDGSPCLLGSVKANLGHLEAAAGATGLIKAVLALRHGAVPPQPDFGRLNPHITLGGTRLAIPTELTPWAAGGMPRCAAVSSFGIGGTNAHVILEEAPRLPAPEAAPADAAWLLPLSAKTPAGLRAAAESWAEFLDTTEAGIGDLCHTAARRRSTYEARLAVVGRTKAELRAALNEHLAGGLAAPVTVSGAGPVAFVFSGQGPQWHGMGRELLAAEPVFRAAMEECDALLRPLSGWSLLEELARPDELSRLHQTSVAQPALFALQVALAALWQSWGVVPDAVIGHSVGEIAALHVAGVFTLADAMRVVWHRGRVMQQAEGLGRMAAVAMSEAEAAALIADHGDRLSIAAINAPRSIVLSGEATAIEAALAAAGAQGIECQPLPVQYAFHSAQMAPFQRELIAALGAVPSAPARLPVFSTVTGGRAEGIRFDAAYIARNMREPVRFAGAIAGLQAEGFGLFVEIAPHPVLARSVADCLAALGGTAAVLPSLRRGRPERETMLRACAGLYAAGHDPAWAKIAPAEGQIVTLPAYPWQRNRHWLRRAAPPAARRDPAEAHPLLGRRIALAGIEAQVFEGGFDGTPEWLADHRVFGRLILPGAAMAELLLAGAAQAMGWPRARLSGLAILRPLPLPEPGEATVARWQVVVKPRPDGGADTTLYAAPDWQAVASAVAEASQAEPVALPDDVSGKTALAIPAIYDDFARLGVAFGPAFRCLDRVALEADDAPSWAEAWIELPAGLESAVFHGPHPVLVDAALQLCSVAARRRAGGTPAIFLPIGADRVEVWPAPASGRLRARARLAPAAGSVEVADVTLETPAGAVVFAIQGMRFARAEPGANREAGASAADVTQDLYTLGWVPAPDAAPVPAISAGGNWLVFADAGGTAETLAAALTAAGGCCHIVRAGSGFARLSGRAWTINPADPAHMRRLLAEEAVSRGLAQGGVIHAFALDNAVGVPAEPTPGDALAVASALHLFQSLAALPRPGALWLLTRGAQTVTGAEALAEMRPQAAGLWGLASVAALEHPDLGIRIIDLDTAQDAADGARLLGQLRDDPGDGGGARLALRGAGRFVPRLRDYAGQATTPAGGAPMRLEILRPGSIDGLGFKTLAPGPLAPDEVRLRVLASALNFRDVLATLDMYPGEAPPLGLECTGLVVEAGSAVTTLRTGDRVFGYAPGAFGTEVVVPAAFLAPMPPAWHAEDAAGIAVAFLTAQYGLFDLAGLRRGERVLIHAAAGGVGLAAVQLAQRAGAEVFATAGSPAKRDLLRGLGVAQVMDSRSLGFADDIMAATGGRGVDVVLNSLAGGFIPAGIRSLASGGRFLELGKRGVWTAGQVAALRPDAQYHLYDLGALAQADRSLLPSLYPAIMPGFADGSLHPLPRTVFPFAQYAEAFRTMALARHAGKIVLSVTAEGARAAPAVSPEASYWITGGLGALGLATAEWLARSGARHLVLTGRRPPGEAARLRIRALEEGGVAVHCLAADAAEPASMARVLETIARALPPLRGVVHAAGTTHDAALLNQSWAEGAAVLRGKAHGAWLLHALTRDLPLDFFILYSAAGLLLGAPGQGLYAAANAELDALAQYRRRMGLPALSVAWGAWGGGGMAASLADRGNNTWQARGLRWIEPELGFAALARLLADGVTHGAVIPIDWRQFQARLSAGADRAFFADLTKQAPAAPAGGPREARALPRRLLDLPIGLRRQSLIAELRERVLELLALDSGRPVAPRAPLKDLGLDSLMAVELRNTLVRAGGVTLPATLLFDHPTLDALASYLVDAWQLDEAATIAPAAPDIAEPDIADLSDAEAEMLLERELSAGADA